MKKETRGRKPKKEDTKRLRRVNLYLNDDEKKRYDRVKLMLEEYTDLRINDLFRKVIDNFSLELLDFLNLTSLDALRKDLKTKGIYKNIFEKI